jgi:hypothetical protein
MCNVVLHSMNPLTFKPLNRQNTFVSTTFQVFLRSERKDRVIFCLWSSIRDSTICRIVMKSGMKFLYKKIQLG